MTHIDERRWHLDPYQPWSQTIAEAVADLRHEGIRNGRWHTEGGEWLVFLIMSGRRAKAPARDRVKSAGGVFGNHNRWHIGREVHDPSCIYCCELLDTAPTWVRRGLIWVAEPTRSEKDEAA